MNIPLGVYTHYKGNRYEVIGEAIHTETQEPMVLYKALYKGNFPEGTIWARPLEMFSEIVIKDGKAVPRFKAENL